MPLEASLDLLRSQLAEAAPAPESMKLLQAVWPRLDDSMRERLLAQLGSPASEDDVSRWKEDEDLHRRLLRQWRWLVGLSDDLPAEWREAQRRLTETFGEGDPSGRRRTFTVRAGSISLLSAEEIATLGPDRFADWLAEWEVPPRGWESPTPAGLADQLSHAVQAAPAEWDERLPDLVYRLRHPTYIRAVLEGLRTATKERPDVIAWDRLVATLELVTSEPWEVDRIAEDDFDADRDWGETHRIATWLIEEAVNRDEEFSVYVLERLWNVLLASMRRRARESGVSGTDVLTAAINKVSTRALEAMFALVLSVSRRELDLYPWSERLLAAVEEELGMGSPEAEFAGAIVARFFPQLRYVCGARADAIVERLFGEPRAESLRVGPFETLISWARPISNEMLVQFRPYLRAYLELTSAKSNDEERRQGPRWLMIGYLRGVTGYQDVREILDELAVPDRISEAAEYAGRMLREEKDPEDDVVARALLFWDTALEDQTLDTASYDGFGWWAEASMIPGDAWLDRMYQTLERTKGRIDWDDQVVQRLIALSHHPDAWRALVLLVRGATDRWTVSYWGRNLHGLLEGSAGCEDPIKTLRRELVEALLERELIDFRKYL